MSSFNVNFLPNEYIHEVNILGKFMNNHFIQKLISSFHDYDNLYFVSKLYENRIADYLGHTWNEKKIRFFAACLIQCFIALRKHHLIHRDVHFWNLMLDEKYYIVLIDFHIAMDYKHKNDPQEYRVGSPDFCAPEMIKGLEYDYNSDYYRLGAMIYNVTFGEFPTEYMARNNLTSMKIHYNKTQNYSYSCIDFINKLMISDKNKRLGFNSIKELKDHEFFKDFDWINFKNRMIESPFKPKNITRKIYNHTFIYQKRMFLNNELIKNERIRNIFLSFDKINNKIATNIFNTFLI